MNEIDSLETFYKIVRQKVEDDFKRNSYNIKQKLYEIHRKYDGAGRNKGYYLENSNLHGKDLSALLYKVFEEREYKMIYEFFGLTPFIIKPEITFANVPLEKEGYNVKHYEYIEFEEIKLLTAIEKCEPVIILNEDEEENIANDCHMNVEILSKDYFAPGIMALIEFDYVDNINPWVIIEYSNRFLKCNVYGLRKNDKLELWIEYLLTSWSLYAVGNEKMAFLTAFASLDSYIEMQYETLKMIYLDVACLISDEEVMKECINKYTLYSNQQRRIIDDKFKDIMKERVADVSLYSDIYNKLYKFEKIRNQIAHCVPGDVEVDYIDLLYTILRAMYITTYDADLIELFIKYE